jgi:hypothetical protein
MKRIAPDLLLQTAVVGVVGRGGTGIVSRCSECRWERLGWGPCGGFGEGCLVRREPPREETRDEPSD